MPETCIHTYVYIYISPKHVFLGNFLSKAGFFLFLLSAVFPLRICEAHAAIVVEKKMLPLAAIEGQLAKISGRQQQK